ncbi:conserved hypothetical protein [Planktothrix sp. PCC 11201]|uniref:DUF433 domain-containing protein n=1 Tax=Planktothrix sp. PCC 11201 TaxID=1729650 RepID=UPI00090F431F|nr:DUF433 domain-containing protein [Planktothrix sp. PCC 11201]SKB14108.1 conserved hypothetical protein [Planktothrix sp. PCC 11201]
MSTTLTDIGTLIVSTPGICGGRPRITGTRMSVMSIAIDYNAGMTVEEILQEFPHLNLGQIYAALTYYHVNKFSIDQEITAYYEECDRLEKEQLNSLLASALKTKINPLLYKNKGVKDSSKN